MTNQTPHLKKTEIPEERPVFNVSFFSQNLAPIESETEKQVAEEKTTPEESNVPTFINTWQNWLKIDRSKIEVSQKTDIKSRNKKYSHWKFHRKKNRKFQNLKKNLILSWRKKSDNISAPDDRKRLRNFTFERETVFQGHQSVQDLIGKHSGKEAHFAEQINYVKDLRQNK